MFAAILDTILSRLIKVGHLAVDWPDGRRTAYAGTPGPEAHIRLATAAVARRLVLNPSLAAGECYMDGTLEPVNCTIFDVLDVFMTNIWSNETSHPVAHILDRLAMWRRAFHRNMIDRSVRNVRHHYDLDGGVYDRMLDTRKQYSCAYFRTGMETLEQSQIDKQNHIAAKLCLTEPGLRVLDIGCGWGELAITLARDFGAQVTGITLSQEQFREAQRRAEAAGVADRVEFRLQDYRHVTETFDRIVSVGMFEHVGTTQYDVFFRQVGKLLKRDGVALLHTIGRLEPPSCTNAWIEKYIFPGGYCPALSEVTTPVERAALAVSDIEILRLHYAATLRQWRRRFMANRPAILDLYDERFFRMFAFYLAGSELAFRRQRHVVFQVQLTHDVAAAPVTRDYLYRDTTATAAPAPAVRPVAARPRPEAVLAR